MDWTFVILFVLLFLFSIYIGFLSGQGICDRYVVTRRDYWVANLAGMLIAAVFIGLIALLPLLYAVALGGFGGYVAGLRMNFDEAVGPWKLVERFTGLSAGRRKKEAAADPRTREERRRRRKAGRPDDLMSVEGEHGTQGRGQAGPRTSSKKKGTR